MSNSAKFQTLFHGTQERTRTELRCGAKVLERILIHQRHQASSTMYSPPKPATKVPGHDHFSDSMSLKDAGFILEVNFFLKVSQS